MRISKQKWHSWANKTMKSPKLQQNLVQNCFPNQIENMLVFVHIWKMKMKRVAENILKVNAIKNFSI